MCMLHWFGSPDGFLSHEGSIRPSSPTINDNYVVGISLSYGDSYMDEIISCPCNVPEYYVGDD